MPTNITFMAIIKIIIIIIGLLYFYKFIKITYLLIIIKKYERKHKSKFLMITDIESNLYLGPYIYNLCFAEYIIDINNSEQFQYWIADIVHKKINRIDIVVQSYGGCIFNNDIIITNLISFDGIINTYIPFYAYSAGTMIALCGNNIYMNKFSLLSPTDPQITVNKQVYSSKSLIDIAKNTINVERTKDMTIKLNAIEAKKTHINNLDALRTMFNKKKYNSNTINKILDEFGSGKHDHSKPFTREFIKSIGIKINYPIPNNIIWITKNII
jgi:membrane-bound ClpP family serine protease